MTPEEVSEILAAHRPALDAFGVQSVALFGSVARREARTDSDVDLYVQFDSAPNFDRYMGLVLALESWMQRRVDVVTPGSLRRKERWRATLEREALRVA